MKHLAVDFGKKRLGLAMSDESGRFAVPYEVRERRGLKRDVAELLQAARSLRVERVVFGLPRQAEGAAVHHESEVGRISPPRQKPLDHGQNAV
jgi:putative Holliday junction resolvase